MLSSLYTEAERNTTYWFVMRAYKNEKLAEERLSGKNGLEYYIPKRYAIRVYHGVKSKRLVPVIPSLIFVHATQVQIAEFKKNEYNLLQFVKWENKEGGQYLIVSDENMDSFIKISSQYEDSIEYYKPEEIRLEKGTRVLIHGGKFDGVKGVFVRVEGKRNRRVVVMLEGVTAVAAEVDPDLVEVLS